MPSPRRLRNWIPFLSSRPRRSLDLIRSTCWGPEAPDQHLYVGQRARALADYSSVAEAIKGVTLGVTPLGRTGEPEDGGLVALNDLVLPGHPDPRPPRSHHRGCTGRRCSTELPRRRLCRFPRMFRVAINRVERSASDDRTRENPWSRSPAPRRRRRTKQHSRARRFPSALETQEPNLRQLPRHRNMRLGALETRRA